MDYAALQGEVTSLSTSSPIAAGVGEVKHRMPTVSAAEALGRLKGTTGRGIRTGLEGIDKSGNGGLGVKRCQVTEIYGPPGVGKTTLGLQLAVNSLRDGAEVLWIDAANPLSGSRLVEMLSHSASSEELNDRPGEVAADEDLLEKLVHFTVPSLPQFVALLCNTSGSFAPPKSSLLVVDGLSSLIMSAYPRIVENTSISHNPSAPRQPDKKQWAASRKWSVLQYIITSLQKLATLHDIAIVILTQTVTRMKTGARASLVPAISSPAWDAGIATRIVLFRDWGWAGQQVRFARLLKSQGKKPTGLTTIPFIIKDTGLHQIPPPDITTTPSIASTPSRKRKANEIQDSEDDEDYGWADDHDADADAEDLQPQPHPPPPLSQWLGSEDILLAPPSPLSRCPVEYDRERLAEIYELDSDTETVVYEEYAMEALLLMAEEQEEIPDV